MENFTIGWSGFEGNAGNSFRSVYEEDVFKDVTLACDDDQQVRAHKFILMASSSFFRKILLRHPNNVNQIIFLRGTSYSLLKNVVDFLYVGSVQVPQTDFQKFLYLAKDLKISGLMDFQNNSM